MIKCVGLFLLAHNHRQLVGQTIPEDYIFFQNLPKTGSLFMVALEHSIYGCIVFTSELVRFFYNF